MHPHHGPQSPQRLQGVNRRGGVTPPAQWIQQVVVPTGVGTPIHEPSTIAPMRLRPSTGRTDRLLNVTCLLASFTPLPRRSDDREEEPPCKKQSAQDEFRKVSHSVQKNDRPHQDNSDQSHDFHVAHPAG